MINKAMERAIRRKEAIDISGTPRSDSGRYYVLAKFVEGKDYCDAKQERWVWSIGRRKEDGVIHASLYADLYMNSKYECLWLR